jgi:hypothetical protein
MIVKNREVAKPSPALQRKPDVFRNPMNLFGASRVRSLNLEQNGEHKMLGSNITRAGMLLLAALCIPSGTTQAAVPHLRRMAGSSSAAAWWTCPMERGTAAAGPLTTWVGRRRTAPEFEMRQRKL